MHKGSTLGNCLEDRHITVDIYHMHQYVLSHYKDLMNIVTNSDIPDIRISFTAPSDITYGDFISGNLLDDYDGFMVVPTFHILKVADDDNKSYHTCVQMTYPVGNAWANNIHDEVFYDSDDFQPRKYFS